MPVVEPLSPWSEQPEDDAPLERQLSRGFAAVPEPVPLPSIARQRVPLVCATGRHAVQAAGARFDGRRSRSRRLRRGRGRVGQPALAQPETCGRHAYRA